MMQHDHPEHKSGSQEWNDETAEWYTAEYGDHISNALTVRNIGLQESDIILDVGCGSGTACREASKLVPKGKVIGIDPTSAMIRISKEQTTDEFKNVEFLEGSAEEIPFPDDFFTVVTAINSLHHWTDYKKGLDEVMRVLRPGGRFFVSDEIVEGGGCGHGEGLLSKPSKVMSELKSAGFKNGSLETHEENGEGIYLFNAVKI